MFCRFHKSLFAVALVTLPACREDMPTGPPAGALVRGNRLSELQPGGATPVRSMTNPFEGNEEAIAEGKKLYDHYNCSGCHAAGGGAIGPALMDDKWIYGGSSANIFWTIIEGRPQGMPSFGGRIAEDQVWRIAAFVRSLSGAPKEGTAEAKQQSPPAGTP
jgi:cytochrome c oxidase cbb3-type subunit 3